MATHQHHFAQQQLSRERRRNVRVAPELLTYVSFGGSNGGMVLDISEDGMALATAFAIPDASLLDISIPADPTHELIEVTGRVAWIAESKRRLGVRLVDAPPRTQELLRGWISAVQTLRDDGRANSEEGMPEDETAVAEFPSGATVARTLTTPPAAAQPLAKRSIEIQLNATQPAKTQFASRSAKTAETIPERIVRDVPAPQGEFSDFLPKVVTPPSTHAAPLRNAHDDRPPVVLEAQNSFPSWITESRRVPLATAFVIVVIGGFAMGIVIGRSVLARWSHRASATTAGESRATDGARPATALQTTTPAASVANSNGPDSAAVDSNARPAPPSVASSASRSDGNSLGSNSSGNNSSANSADAALPGGEILVTPNVGDAPLRVDLGEEVIAHSPSLEIRSRRFIFVPGVATSGHHKPRKERLEVGILVSRVTPRLSAAPLGANGSQNGEQVAAVRVTIAGDGHIVNVDPLSGPSTVMPSVMAAIREWRYDPSSLNGKPVETQADLTFKFRPLR